MPLPREATTPNEQEARLQHLCEAALQGGGPQAFRATLIRAGASANGFVYPAETLQQALPLFAGATAFVDHAGAADLWRGTRSVRDAVGAFGPPAWNDVSQGIEADLYLIDDDVARLLGRYVQARAQGQPAPNLGISADLTVAHQGGRVTRIVRVHSADIVFGPAAGGAIHHALAALPHLQEAQPMTTPTSPSNDATARAALAAPAPPDTEAQAARTALAQDLLRARLHLNADLPAAAREHLRRRFEGRAFHPDELEAELRSLRELTAQVRGNPVQGHGQPRLALGATPLERIQLAADRLFHVPGAPADAPRLSGIRELYLTLTGDDELRGMFNPAGLRLSEAEITTSTFAHVCKNAMNKALLAAYNTRSRWWEPLVWEEDFESTQQITWVKTGTVSALSTVAEGDPYDELESDDAAETTSFVKKGGYIGLTLEAIDRDDMAALRRAPRELGFAAWLTLSNLVSEVFTAGDGAGPTMADAKALFHVDHGNLGSSALSATAWEAVVKAMFEQGDPANGYTLGLRPAFCLAPIELERTALELFQSALEPGSADNNANPYYRMAKVITVPHWTDENSWAAVAPPTECPGICIGYRYGRAPELFVADQPHVGSMFTNDELRIKVRFFLAVGVADHRPLYKMNVP
ncbi:MAG: hypothetical protein GX605_09110 [Chloroflexi bacterium]|nr:hypothetical protein [Chloroflexota bacterium]